MYLPCVLSAASNSDIENGRLRVNSGIERYQSVKR
jgi:hypothetical protein